MDVEIGTAALLETPGNPQRVKAYFMGGVPKKQMLFSVPDGAKHQQRLRGSKRVTVRYLHEGTLFGFQTPVLDFRLTPAPTLSLCWPPELEKLEIRKYDRISCNIPISVVAGAGEIRGLINDLSAGGCGMVFNGSTVMGDFALGSKIKADFHVFDPLNTYHLQGVLVHRSLEGNKLLLGLRFENNGERTQKLIEEYVDRVLILLGLDE